MYSTFCMVCVGTYYIPLNDSHGNENTAVIFLARKQDTIISFLSTYILCSTYPIKQLSPPEYGWTMATNSQDVPLRPTLAGDISEAAIMRSIDWGLHRAEPNYHQRTRGYARTYLWLRCVEMSGAMTAGGILCSITSFIGFYLFKSRIRFILSSKLIINFMINWSIAF